MKHSDKYLDIAKKSSERYACIDPKRKCNYLDPINLLEFNSKNQDLFNLPRNKFAEARKERICKDIHMKYDGEVDLFQCCDKKSPYANKKIDKAYSIFPPVKVCYNADGSINNFKVCECNGVGKEYDDCVNKHCKDYRTATNYEQCKYTHTDFGKVNFPFGVGNDNDEEGEEEGNPIIDIPPNALGKDCYAQKCSNVEHFEEDPQESEERPMVDAPNMIMILFIIAISLLVFGLLGRVFLIRSLR